MNGKEPYFAGREFELQQLRSRLARNNRNPETILSVSGIGGIGKTALLAAYRQVAVDMGALFAWTDAGESTGEPSGWMLEASRQLGLTLDGASDEAGFISALNDKAATDRIVIAVDGYEQAGPLDEWLRDCLLPRLSPGVILIIAGRHPLRGPWLLSPRLRRLILPLPLSCLTYGELKQSLALRGISDGAWIDTLWLETSGHPLMVSLLVPLGANRGPAGLMGALPAADRRDALEALLSLWLAEAPDEDLR